MTNKRVWKSKAHGWFNQPEVVCFKGYDKYAVRYAIEKELGIECSILTHWKSSDSYFIDGVIFDSIHYPHDEIIRTIKSVK